LLLCEQQKGVDRDSLDFDDRSHVLLSSPVDKNVTGIFYL